LQQRTDVQIEIEGMNGKPFRRFASLSCSLQVSGTLRQKAIMLLSTAIFLCNAAFGSSGSPAAFALKLLMN
jgi:hypothetical protein